MGHLQEPGDITPVTPEELRQVELFTEIDGPFLEQLLEQGLTEAALKEILASHPDAMQALIRAAAHQMQTLQEEVLQRTERLRETQFEIIYRLGRAAEFRDDEQSPAWGPAP